MAEQIGEKEMVFAARFLRLNALWSLGDRAAVDVEVATLSALADDLRQPAQRWSVGTDWTMLALMEGRFEEAERLIAETLALGEQAESWNAHVTERLALFVLRRAQGRLAELEDAISRSVHEYPALLRFRSALAHLYGELGRERDARTTLESVLARPRDRIPRRRVAVHGRSAPGSLRLRRARGRRRHALLAAASLREPLRPGARRGQLGSIARGLGVLATALRRFDDAERHFQVALEVETRMRARPWLAHTKHDLARMLVARDGLGDQERASDLVAEAVRTYRQLGMEAWAGRAEAI